MNISNKLLFIFIFIFSFVFSFSTGVCAQAELVQLSSGESMSSQDLFSLAVALEKKYPTLIYVDIIGYSVDQKPLYSIIMTADVDTLRRQKDFNILRQHYFVEAGTHARETVNPLIVMKQIEDYAIDYHQENHIQEFSLSQMLEEVAIHFLPLTNPDGFDLVKFGEASVQTQHGRKLLLSVGDDHYTNFKSGISGVDHNRNYPQHYFDMDENIWKNIWQLNISTLHATSPSAEFYPGPHPASEPEVKTVMNYILRYDFRNYISFHSRGNVLYWNKYFAPDYYNQRSKTLAQTIQIANGYELMDEDNGLGSGYLSDFTSSETLKPLITVETLPISTDLPTQAHLYPTAYEANRLVPLYAISEGQKTGYFPYRLYVDDVYVRDFENPTYANAIAQKYNGKIVEGDATPSMFLNKKKRTHSIYEFLIKHLPLI